MKKGALVEVVREDLKALLFWAHVGVRQSKGGAYEEEIVHIINSYAENVKLQLPKTCFKKASDEPPR
jgi:hypothetical protein